MWRTIKSGQVLQRLVDDISHLQKQRAALLPELNKQFKAITELREQPEYRDLSLKSHPIILTTGKHLGIAQEEISKSNSHIAMQEKSEVEALGKGPPWFILGPLRSWIEQRMIQRASHLYDVSTASLHRCRESLNGLKEINETVCYAIRMNSSQEPEDPSIFEKYQSYRAHSTDSEQERDYRH